VRSIIHRPLFSLATALISAFTGLAVAAAPGVCADLPPLRADHSPYFSADIVTALDTDGRPALGVSITVPYQELSWVRPTGDPGDTRLAARAEFTIVFDPGKSKALDGDVWERRVVVAGYSAARSPNSVMLEKRTFKVPPGRYELRISVRDMNAEVQSSAAEKVDVPDYSKITVGFTDLELGLSDSAGTFIPVPTRVMGLEVTRLAARVALFDRRGGEWPRQYPLHFRLLDDAGEALREGDTTVTIAHSGDPVTIRPPATELFLGHYTFEVELSDHKSKWRVDRSFDVDESGPPRGREFERMLEPLSYIATSEEISYLRSLPPDQQARGWQEFWRRRDPTPDTPRNEALVEFFRRVRHADKQFQGFGPGWRSDMGRIYIKYGPPNHPATAQSAQLEIWYYNQPYRRFVFRDSEGFGRYVLVSPSLE
jgi:GWxTD domain-containing protein